MSSRRTKKGKKSSKKGRSLSSTSDPPRLVPDLSTVSGLAPPALDASAPDALSDGTPITPEHATARLKEVWREYLDLAPLGQEKLKNYPPPDAVMLPYAEKCREGWNEMLRKMSPARFRKWDAQRIRKCRTMHANEAPKRFENLFRASWSTTCVVENCSSGDGGGGEASRGKNGSLFDAAAQPPSAYGTPSLAATAAAREQCEEHGAASAASLAGASRSGGLVVATTTALASAALGGRPSVAWVYRGEVDNLVYFYVFRATQESLQEQGDSPAKETSCAFYCIYEGAGVLQDVPVLPRDAAEGCERFVKNLAVISLLEERAHRCEALKLGERVTISESLQKMADALKLNNTDKMKSQYMDSRSLIIDLVVSAQPGAPGDVAKRHELLRKECEEIQLGSPSRLLKNTVGANLRASLTATLRAQMQPQGVPSVATPPASETPTAAPSASDPAPCPEFRVPPAIPTVHTPKSGPTGVPAEEYNDDDDLPDLVPLEQIPKDVRTMMIHETTPGRTDFKGTARTRLAHFGRAVGSAVVNNVRDSRDVWHWGTPDPNCKNRDEALGLGQRAAQWAPSEHINFSLGGGDEVEEAQKLRDLLYACCGPSLTPEKAAAILQTLTLGIAQGKAEVLLPMTASANGKFGGTTLRLTST